MPIAGAAGGGGGGCGKTETGRLMNLSHLYYFKKLAEVKHFTKASQELFIAQPTLSAAISQLEKELGVPLFEKGRRTVELTEYGRDFHAYVCQALQSLDKGVEVVQERAGRINGVLNLGTIYAMQGRSWSEAISEFRDSVKTSTQINIKQGFSGLLMGMLEAGELDVAFAGLASDDPNICSIPCWSQELAVAVSKDHPLARRELIWLDELAPYHLLSYQQGNPSSKELDDLLAGHDLDVDYGYNDEITLCSLVTSDSESAALFAYSFLVQSFENISLISVRDAPKDFHRVYLSFRKESHAPVVDKFIDFITSYHFPPALIGTR